MVFLFADGSASLAQGLGVDWKLYGGANVGGESLCFYDAKGLIQQPTGHLRVWTKCVSKGEVDAIFDKDGDKRIIEATAEKVMSGYVPPIAGIQNVDLMVITAYEEVADMAALQPQSRIFYELNCPDRMLRELSIDLNVDGRIGSRNKPSDWKYVSPETNGAALLKILCQKP
jgi:hypothetical protein